MSKKGQTHSFPVRRALVLAVLMLAFGGLLWRAVDLHVLDRDFLQGQGDARSLRVVAIPAHRGMVTDRHGEPLAISTPVETVWANPQELVEAPDRWSELARALELSPQRLARRIRGRADKEFMYLRRQLPPERARRILELGVPGVSLRREYKRYYPTSEVAAHVVGFTNVDDRGQEGVELMYDDWLRGTPGSKRVVKDRLGRIVENVERLAEPKPGRDLRLSLDRRVQFLAYRELKAAIQRHQARSGSAVVLDARTGEVLAMVNQPAYNPNNRADFSSARYRNRAVTDVFEPGSTIKPFTVAAALESGEFRPGTPVDTAPGWYTLHGHTIQDVHNYGQLDVARVIKKSSNVGASRIALALDSDRLWQTLSGAGFGLDTGSGFPGEAGGHLSHFRGWGDVEKATLAFGYGVSVTPLQLAQAYTAVAGDGRVLPIRFLAAEGERPEPQSRPFSARTAREVRRMMEAVVGPGGTAPRAKVPGYRIAGKTGTVHKSKAGGYAEDRYTAVFVGLAPASRPRLVMAVVVDEPSAGDYYGGQVAAPVFSRVVGGALRLLNVPPDDLPEAKTRLALSHPDPSGGAPGAVVEARP
mgnify:CR=1 FL=1